MPEVWSRRHLLAVAPANERPIRARQARQLAELLEYIIVSADWAPTVPVSSDECKVLSEGTVDRILARSITHSALSTQRLALG